MKVHEPACGVEIGIDVRDGLSVADRDGMRRIPVGRR